MWFELMTNRWRVGRSTHCVTQLDDTAKFATIQYSSCINKSPSKDLKIAENECACYIKAEEQGFNRHFISRFGAVQLYNYAGVNGSK